LVTIDRATSEIRRAAKQNGLLGQHSCRAAIIIVIVVVVIIIIRQTVERHYDRRYRCADTDFVILPRKKAKERIAVNGFPSHCYRDVTCHMGPHSVTCYPTQVNAPRPT